MASADFLALLPLLVTAASSLIVLLLAAFHRAHGLAAGVTSSGLAVALMTLPVASRVAPRQVTTLLMVDAYAIFYIGLLLAASMAIAGLSYGYLEKRRDRQEEFYVLLLLATLGAITLAAATHFASFFLGLELLSLSLYVLIAYVRTDRQPLEAGLKYLILSGTSSAFLLFGMALLYFQSGAMGFAALASDLGRQTELSVQVLVGLVLILTGVGFKLALVPFHMWAPDVYQGAPAPVAAFVATASKGAMVALLLRYFTEIAAFRSAALWWTMAGIAVLSMFVGNLLALLQDNVKRMLAYSSIAHLGYLLVALLAGGPLAVEAVTVYLTTYFITTIGAFGVVAVLSGPNGEADSMEDYRSLFRRRPWIAAVFTIMLLSLAGIPLTAGFLGKFYVIAAGVDSSLWLLLVLLVANSVIGLFYYLRVIVAMFTETDLGDDRAWKAPVMSASYLDGVVLVALSGLLFWLGLYPEPLIRLIRTMERSLTG
ncbi:MAG: NADH-ubiquinone oxidoreductase chain N [Nitrospira sp.]|jgi:NADH-quinone oxidoreductase subunit N|nr:MAG: NADH-ubiquinone oxidoreductase chain N [Nitrospira sp.]